MADKRPQKGTKELVVIDKEDVGAMPPTLVAPQLPAAASAFLEGSKHRRAEPPKVPLVSVLHREQKFLLPSGEMVDSVSGYPIYYFQTRRYYKKPPAQGAKGVPPDCLSTDMIVPSQNSLDQQAQTCAECAMNQWNTGRSGSGKACSTQTWVFLLNPGAFGRSPLAVVVFPPSSIRALMGTRFENGYFSQCADRHGCYEIVWTTIRLEQMGDQVVYCVAKPEMGQVIENVEDAKKVSSMRNQFVAAMEAMRGETSVLATAPEEG